MSRSSKSIGSHIVYICCVEFQTCSKLHIIEYIVLFRLKDILINNITERKGYETLYECLMIIQCESKHVAI
jgi:hypothetical protein